MGTNHRRQAQQCDNAGKWNRSCATSVCSVEQDRAALQGVFTSKLRAAEPTREFLITVAVAARCQGDHRFAAQSGIEVAVKERKTEPEPPKLVG
jgi:hypothetical protein